MKFVDMENWNRKEHYNYFSQLDYPHFNICGNVDITAFYKYVKENGLPFFVSVLYAAAKTANSIREFRYRIRDGKVIEHEVVNPSFTVMAKDEVFSFCTARYMEGFDDFTYYTLMEIEKIQNKISIEDEPGKDDLIYITSIPWISFTSITHPIHMNPVDSIPRISWGKFFQEGETIKLPISVQVHHALVDGVHIGRFFSGLQEILDKPEKYL